jgi:hypothetical protein
VKRIFLAIFMGPAEVVPTPAVPSVSSHISIGSCLTKEQLKEI